MSANDTRTQLLALEKDFWTGDAAFYRRNLAADALMVFADPVGVLTGDAIADSIGSSARWTSIDMTDVRFLTVSSGAELLTYRASAIRADAKSPYLARATSLYVRRDGSWKLAFHQQTPGQP